MTRKRRRTPLYIAAIFTLAVVVLALTSRGWGPNLVTRYAPAARHVEPMPSALGVREGAQEAVPPEKITILKKFSFDQGQDSLKAWEEKVFKGQTEFRVEE